MPWKLLFVLFFLCLSTQGSSVKILTSFKSIDYVLKKDEFLWGSASAAYQVEGSVDVGGKSPSIWDEFSKIPGKIKNGDSGDVADDSYHQYQVDIKLLSDLHVSSYRFSISWSRIISENGTILEDGVNYYNNIINMLIDRGIKPLVTLFHWDLPKYLEDRYDGWLSPLIADDFVHYADVCFKKFGDRVKLWATLNEPWTYCFMGYDLGIFAPGRCSDRSRCPNGQRGVEIYRAAHNMLLAHSKVVRHYRHQYQASQKGAIGIVLNLEWAEPWRADSADDIEAAQRNNEFKFAWFADPILRGAYPLSMRQRIGDRLPIFTAAESQLLVNSSIDFLGLNHYSSKYYTINTDSTSNIGWIEDQNVKETKYSVDQKIIGPQAESSWLNVVPWGFRNVLKWVYARYYHDMDPEAVLPILVTENGCDVPNESSLSFPSVLNDSFR